MCFEEQTIPVFDRDHIPHTMSAVVGVQDDGILTGLVYHPYFYSFENGSPKVKPWFSLTHLASSLLIDTDESVVDEAVARRWLELAASLTNWMQPTEALKSRIALLRAQVKAVRYHVCKEVREGVSTLIAG